MLITESSHPAVSAAQQVLVQVKYGYIEDVAQLPFEATGVSANAAQLVIGRDQGKSLPAAAAGAAKRRCAERCRGKERGMGFKLERRHDFSLPITAPLLPRPTSRSVVALSEFYRWSRTDLTVMPPIPQTAKAMMNAIPTDRPRLGYKESSGKLG